MELELFGTLGPACHDRELLARMIRTGMNGIRLNLSHGALTQRADWIEALHQAEADTGQPVLLLMDLKGRELRTGEMTPRQLEEGEQVVLGTDIPADPSLLALIQPDMNIQIDDGRILLKSGTQTPDGGWKCTVLRGGCLSGRKSVYLEGAPVPFSPICAEDLENLDQASRFGVGALMVPFVQSAADLQQVRQELARRDLDLKLYAKIENLEGVRNLESLLPLADVIVIARGDLGQTVGLVQLPAIQRDLERRCQVAGKPYMVVTELLTSMCQSPVCTRAEANDVFRAVADGASAVMLTNETAAGQYPEEAMTVLCALAREGQKATESK